MKEIYLAGGCFWGTQKFVDQFDGVLETAVGYANGKTENPSYEDVCYRDTGHAETVRIRYDETVLPTQALLRYYFMTILFQSTGRVETSGRSTAPGSTIQTGRLSRTSPRSSGRRRTRPAGHLPWKLSLWRASGKRRNTIRSIWIKTLWDTAISPGTCFI